MVTDLKREIENQGFARMGEIGGQPKQTYWTPDGRQIKAMPDLHEYARKSASGKVIESGVRDANLDKGWFLAKPEHPQLYCPHCDKWHATQADIKNCANSKKKLIQKSLKVTKKELKQDDERIVNLENKIDRIESLLQQLVKKDSGSI